MEQKPPYYTIDEDTRQLMQNVLDIAQRTVDNQYHVASVTSLERQLAELRLRFGIGSDRPPRGKPKLTVIDCSLSHEPQEDK